MSKNQEQKIQETSATNENNDSRSPLEKIYDLVNVDETQKPVVKDLVAEFVDQIMKETQTVSKSAEAMINTRISEIDQLISDQLNAVMHHSSFQGLEGSWRGLKQLVDNSETGEHLKIKVMNAAKDELLKDMMDAAVYDNSAIFKKIYTEEYDEYGGNPYSVLIGDYEFANNPKDLTLLEKMSQVAAVAHAPFISAASPLLFGKKSFEELNDIKKIDRHFSGPEYAKWRSFRESEESRYVALTVPHTLTRLPYGNDDSSIPVESFKFEEDVDGTDSKKYLWGNSAYSLAGRLTNAFSLHGWCTAIRGVKNGGLVTGLPTHSFKTKEGDVAMKCPTETAIPETRERELADAGFISLVHRKGSNEAVFLSVQTVNKPKDYGTATVEAANATANARLSSQLQNVMAVSRFAHYLKVIMFENIGSSLTAKQTQELLQNWISGYVCLDSDADNDTKAKFPLNEADVVVQEKPGKPGVYEAEVFLKPHFQLDEIGISLRLVTELPTKEK